MRAVIATVIVLIVLAGLLVVYDRTKETLGLDSDPADEPTPEAKKNKNQDRGRLNLLALNIVKADGEKVTLEAELAQTDEQKERGLMERTELGENRGMLFVFEEEQTLSFWMKNTLIPLSIAYIDESGTIVDIQDMQPLDETPHPSAEPARYALEVNQGFFEENGISVGDRIE
jgi:uncharacterized membrane protein (UPF0127 family)